jgi:hypothetical protein
VQSPRAKRVSLEAKCLNVVHHRKQRGVLPGPAWAAPHTLCGFAVYPVGIIWPLRISRAEMLCRCDDKKNLVVGEFLGQVQQATATTLSTFA